MAWTLTNTDWLNADWAAVAILNELIDAISERKLALGLEAVAQVTAGNDVQAASFWSGLQGEVSAFIQSFVRSHDAGGSAYAAEYYDNTDNGPLLWDSDDVFALAVGAGWTGWRRATTMPADWEDPDDPVFAEGVMQAGDIIGPWIMRDLQAVLNLLVWTRHSPDQSIADTGKLGYSVDEDWPTLKGEVEADYDADLRGNPTANVCAVSFNQYGHYASLFRAKTRGDVTLATHCKRALEWYVWAYTYYDDGVGITLGATFIGWATNHDPVPDLTIDTDYAVFSANGDDVVQNKYHIWETDTPAAPAAIEQAPSWLGSLASRPAWAAYEPDYNTLLGHIGQVLVLARWNIAGGFTYC